MFHLQRNPILTQTALAVWDWTDDARQRLADSSAGLSFNEGEHRYFLHGTEMRSVSSVVHLFDPFDAAKAAERAAVNPRHEHFGKSPEEILAIWERKRDDAADAGTQVHAFGEACYHYMTGEEGLIDPAYRNRITAAGLAAVSPKEEACARWWAGTDWYRFAPVAKETRVVNPSLRYAGTFDLLLFDLSRGAFAQKDYKTNEDLHRWYGDMLRPPLNLLRANDIGKYTVQQTLYTLQLRNIGLPVASNDLIWLREDGFEEIPLETRYQAIIEYAVKATIENV